MEEGMPVSQTVLEQLTFVGKNEPTKQTKTTHLKSDPLYKSLLKMCPHMSPDFVITYISELYKLVS